MTEKPYVPFYKPYGMTDEEYEYEVRIANQKLAEWENEEYYADQIAKMDAKQAEINSTLVAKGFIFQEIDKIAEGLDMEDVEGHIWWHKFKEFIQTL